MTELSPAAQDVLDGYNQDPFSNTGEALAAVLRAAALHCKRDTLILLAIADELEAQCPNDLNFLLAIADELEAQ
jgi:hypothetical protein